MVGGSERHLRILAGRLAAQGGFEVEIATTCATSDATWENVLTPGRSVVDGLVVHRFPARTPDAWAVALTRRVLSRPGATRLLDRLGYQADAVGNGREALTAIEAHAYELVFMDLQMPAMDGFDATRHIRKNQPAHRQPGIIALTANALQSDRDACLAAGMNDFITKPIKLGDVDEVIRRNFPRPPSAA